MNRFSVGFYKKVFAKIYDYRTFILRCGRYQNFAPAMPVIFQIVGMGLLIVYLFAASAFLAIEYQMLLGGILFGAAYIARILGSPFVPSTSLHQKGQIFRLFIMLVCGFLTLRYWFFRTMVTLNFNGISESFFSMLLYGAESYGILIYFLGMFVNSAPMRRAPVLLPDKSDSLPTVDVYIPTYNEPEEMVRLTAMVATQMFYPPEKLNIYILDDGGTVQKLNDPNPKKALEAQKRADRLKTISRDLSIFYATRDENLHAKAGNLNESLMSCECHLDEEAFDKISCINEGINQGCGELILILDCDHVPARDFLRQTVGFFFQDPDLFLLQTPHFFINPDPVEKNLETFRKGPSENEMFYAAIHPGLDFWNASFFCGSAAILRRKHLLEVGGIAGNTITEDAETALGLHARGYNSAYFFKPLIIGLTPETFDDFIVQRSRWAQGMIQIFLLKNPLFQKGLTIFQKACYLNASFFWFFGIARLIFFISPLILLFLGLKIYNASLLQVAAYALPHLAGAYLLSNYLFGQYRHPFFSELYETVQSFYLLPAIFSAIIRPRSPVFKVTPKAVSLEKDFLSHLSMPFYLMSFISLVGYGFGIYRWMSAPGLRDSILICMVWNSFNIVILLSCLGVVWERRQMRKMHRYPTDEAIMIDCGDDTAMLPARLFDLSISGAGILVDADILISDLTDKRIILHAEDSYGERYVLPLEIKHQRRKGSQVILGAIFLEESQESFVKISSFVYGDSSRWKFFSQKGTTTSVGYVSGFLNLLKVGIMGSFVNFRGVYSMFISSMKTLTEKYTNRFLKGQEKVEVKEL